MSQDPNIEIKLAATGGDQAAAEVKKVETAVGEMPASADAAAQKIEDLTDGVEELKKELGPVAKAADEVGDALDDAGKKGGKAAEDLGKIKDAQIGAMEPTLSGLTGGLPHSGWGNAGEPLTDGASGDAVR